ncbi:unnamed protein product [Calypogeia fissa]
MRAFVCFCLDEGENVRKSHPGFSVTKIKEILRDMWTKMSGEEKAPFNAKMREWRERVKQDILTHGADSIYKLDSSDED